MESKQLIPTSPNEIDTSSAVHDRLPPALLEKRQVARLIGCSVRQVSRLVASGRMPPPVRLGGLVRWSRTVVEAWIAEGCPVRRW
jgi:prophage regulatory protein